MSPQCSVLMVGVITCVCAFVKGHSAICPRVHFIVHKSTNIYIYLLNLLMFNWRTIALQYCDGFCHISTWISHRYVYVLYVCPLRLERPSHLPPHPTPLDCHRAPDLSSLSHTANFHWLSSLTYGNVSVLILLSVCSPVPSPHVHKSVLVSLSLRPPCR